ncbi:MAG: hypothetical protein ACRD4Y_08310 [Candidatus Acidiferrales bacterium]
MARRLCGAPLEVAERHEAPPATLDAALHESARAAGVSLFNV